jgi:hypothetical protein
MREFGRSFLLFRSTPDFFLFSFSFRPSGGGFGFASFLTHFFFFFLGHLSSWSESQLREFLLEHGIVSPSGSIEQLRIAAKQQ